MRILHVIPQFPYFGKRTIVGGHASCLLSLAIGQHKAGDEVCILSHVEGRRGWSYIDDGPSVFSLFAGQRSLSVKSGLTFSAAALTWVRRQGSDFDIVHVHSGFADYLILSGLLKQFIEKPVLHTIYCPIPLKGGRWRLPGVYGTLKRLGNRLDWCGGISQSVVESLLAFGIRTAECVRPGLDVERFRLEAPDPGVRDRLGLKNDDLVVLFVGNAKPQKNAIRVLRAIGEVRKYYPNVRLIITTELKQSSNDADLQALTREVAELGLEGSVVHLRIVDNMPSLMKACDLLVAPFLDTFGPSDYFMAALEAMACGKPVVVSAVGGMAEVVSKDVGRLVDPLDVRSIAQGLLDLLGDQDMRLRAGRNAQSLVARLFAQETAVATYRRIYEGVAA